MAASQEYLDKMKTQHKVEMDKRDGKFGPQPMAVPPAQQMSRFDQPYPPNVGYGQPAYGGYPPISQPPPAQGYPPTAYPPPGYPAPGYQRRVAMEGKVEHKFDMQPNNKNMEEYSRMCRERTNKSMIK